MRVFLILILIYFNSCLNNPYSFNQIEFTSSKGEKLYLNSSHWGVTGDYQRTSISKNPLKLKEPSDTSNSVEGLNPFFCQFVNDTLFLFFKDTISYHSAESFYSIIIEYEVIDESFDVFLLEKKGKLYRGTELM